MAAAFFTRIRFRILGIVLLAIIPAVLLIWFSAAERKRRMSAEIEENTLRLARFLASNLERDLSEGEGYLKAVGEVLREKRLLAGGCSEAIGGLMNDSTVYANVGLAGRDGVILCGGKPSPSLAGLGSLDWFHKLDSSSGFSVGFDFNGGLSPQASIVLLLPVAATGIGDPSARKFVFAVMDLDWLNRLAESSRLPAGSAISVTNKKGDAVARYPDPDKWVGKSRQTDLEGLPGQEGTRIANGIDGIKRLYAYAKVAGKGNLVVNVGVVREALLAPANRALWNQLMALGIVALLAIFAAWFGADLFLLKQVRILIGATKSLGAGNLQARSNLSYDSGELGELAKAFDEMAETLEWRNAQLKESEVERADPLARLMEFVECVPEPFLVMDEDLRIVTCNREASELFGLEGDKPFGIGFQELCPDIRIGEIARLFAQPDAPPNRTPRRLLSRTRRHRNAGERFEVEISLARIEIANAPYVLALLKRTLEKVREA